MHWADVVAEQLLQHNQAHVLATAITPSGPIHVGNMREVLTTEAVYRALVDRGGHAELIYIGDTFDPLRKVYPFLSDDYQQYVGMPLSEIPCPCGRHESYAHHFLSPFLESLEELGVHPTVYLAHELYGEGRYHQAIRRALDGADTVRAILSEVSSRDLSSSWVPFTVRCPSCGKLQGEVIDYRYPSVRYRCPSCREEGEVDLRQGGVGKLPWRVDWPARWSMFGVTFEAFGKDHAAAGSSWDTGQRIVREVYGREPPTPLVYEFIHLKGKGAMHGSTGTAVAAEDMLAITPPEVLRFLLMKTEPSRHIDFDTGFGLLDLVDEYDRYERIVFGLEEEQAGVKEAERIYWLSQPHPRAAHVMSAQVPYRHLVTIVQIARDWDQVKEILRRNGEIGELSAYEEGKLRERVDKVSHWLDRFAPESVKFEVQDSLPGIEISGEMRAFFVSLAAALGEQPWDAEAIHQTIHAVAQEQGMPAGRAFRYLYMIVLGQTKGPRAGYFIHSLGREFMLERLAAAAKAGA
ncbi:MAG: lysine--tRNA ligase [Thermoplasmatota archaeon]